MLNPATREAKQTEARAQAKLAAALERSLRRRLRPEFIRVARAASAAYRDGGLHALDHVMHTHQEALRKVLLGHWRATITAFGRRLLLAVRKRKSLEWWEVKLTESEIDSAVADYVETWGAKKVVEIANTTEQRIRDAVQLGSDDGLSTSDIADQIEERTGGAIATSRAQTIARTETHSAAQFGSLAAADSLGLTMQKEWVAVEDDRTREDHADVSGTVIDMDEAFQVGDSEMQYPGDPDGDPGEVINCRCALVYHTVDEEADAGSEAEAAG